MREAPTIEAHMGLYMESLEYQHWGNQWVQEVEGR